MSQTARIGMRIGSADPYWVQMREAVTRQAQQREIELVPVHFSTSIHSAEGQGALFEELIAQRLDALICAYLPDALAYRLLDHGLPIIHLTETTIRHPLCVSTTGYYEIASMIGTYLADQMRGRGRMLLVGGGVEGGAEDGRSRIAGMYDALHTFPAIQMSHVSSAWRYERAYPQIEAALRRWGPPIDAIVGLSDSLALAARDAAHALGLLTDATRVVGINGDPLALAAISEGRMTATVDTPLSTFGAQVIELACAAARGAALPAHLRYAIQLVTAANVSEVALQRLVAIANLPSRLVGVNRQGEQERLVQMEISLEINRRVGAILDRQQLEREITELIRARYGYDAVQLWHTAGDALTNGQASKQRTEPIEGVFGAVLAANRPIFIPDMQASQRFAPDPRWPTTRSRVVVPVHLGGVVRGVLDLHSRRYMPHTLEALNGLQVIADQLGIALHNAELYTEAVEARAAAEKADQLKTRLLANVSHELRAPLNVILGYSRTSLANFAVPPALQDDLRHIYRSGEHLARLMNDLLDLSRAEINELELFPELVNPRALLQETFESMTSGMDLARGVACRLVLPEQLPVISADLVRLRQVLFNLLSNAIKATSAGEIVLGAEATPSHVHIWVADTGAGIPLDVQERIFEPFVSVPHRGQRPEGVGLGLSITRRLVALHQGALRLESAPHQGSTFHVELPLPSMQGQSVATRSAQPTLLLIATGDALPAPVAELSQRWNLRVQRIAPSDDLAARLPDLRPAALAWDLSQGSRAEWALVQQLRSVPQIARTPLLIYGPHGMSVGSAARHGVTSIVPKPLHGAALLDAIAALRWTDTAAPVLIADDDAQTRALYCDLIAQALPEQPVLLAADGAAALRLIAEHTPSLVILDLMMPEIDGFAVLRQMRDRAATQHIPVIVLSGKTLAFEDIKRLDQPHVTLHTKDMLSHDELVATLRDGLHGPPLAHATSGLVKRALVYIQQHYARELSRQEIADAIGVSKNYLSHIFQQELQLSPWEYLNRYRILQAKLLLRGTRESITSIAAHVGFEDASYFGRVFRKQVGCAPHQYREAQVTR